jgi:hypothetical protein
MDALCGDHVPFRISETPAFFPQSLIDTMARWGSEIIQQGSTNQEALRQARKMIPAGFDAPGETRHPLFAAVDFGLTVDTHGEVVPRLIELQGFPTMFVYQAVLTQQYKEVFDLPRELTSFISCGTTDEYLELLRQLVLGTHDPENVVLLELDPHLQKTRVDFILTERACGIRTVNLRDVVREGRELYHVVDGRKVRILRIYNRAIADEVIRSGARTPFRFSDDVDVEWAGHPNWYFLLSKFSIPFLRHPGVPKSFFLTDPDAPRDPRGWVLKPLFSFAGSGVNIDPTWEDVNSIPPAERSNYILQEKVSYHGVVESPHGMTKCEVRIMYFWSEGEPVAVNNLVRMGRGKMMGVDHNKNMLWVGSSAGFYEP